MKTLDKAMQWVEQNTNFFVATVFGIIWSLVFYLAYVSLTDK